MKRLILPFLFASCVFAQCPTAPAFPSAVATDANLLVAANNLSTTLKSPMLSSDTVAVVTSGAGWAANMMASIDSEIMFVSGASGNVLTVSRGCEGTTAAAHAIGSAAIPKNVASNVTAASHNLLRIELEAVEANVAAYLHPLSFSPQWGTFPYSPARGTASIAIGPDGANAADVLHMTYSVSQQAGCPGSCNPGWGPYMATFQETLNSTYGTVSALESSLFLNGNTNGFGSTGFGTYVYENSGTTSQNFGIYADCIPNWVGGGVCISIGAESDVIAGSTAEVIGFSSNLNANLNNNTALIYGSQIGMNYAAGGGSNAGFGSWISANHGTHAAGLQVEEVNSGGTFSQMEVIQSRQSTNNILAMNNGHSGTNTGFPDQIVFSRGSATFSISPVGMIAADSIANGNFGEGYVDIWVAHSSSLRNVARFDNAGNLLLSGGLSVPTDNSSGDFLQVGGGVDATTLALSGVETITSPLGAGLIISGGLSTGAGAGVELFPSNGSGGHNWTFESTVTGASQGAGVLAIHDYTAGADAAVISATLSSFPAVGVGTATSGMFNFGSSGLVTSQILGTSIAASSMGVARFANSNQGPSLNMAHSRSTTIGSQTAVQAADSLGAVNFGGSDGTNNVTGAKILAQAVGTISTGIVPGTMTLQTANASGVLTAGIVIDQAQNVTISNQSANVNFAACYKTGGVLGVCSTVVSSSGGCTCN